MTTPRAHPPQLPASPPAIRAFVGPALIAIAAVIMLAWSWNTWPDPLVDFGTQLYVPWQLTQGKVLYRDIAYYNGPLSQYFNMALFAVAGVGLKTLVFANLGILAIAIVLVYRLALRAGGRLAATCAGLTFVLFFAFNQGVGIGNFNWVTPYTQEITHGLVLALFAILCVDRYLRHSKLIWLIAGGLVIGLTFLTKAEPFAAALAATIAQLVADLWNRRAGALRWVRTISIFVVSALPIPLIAVALLASTMPLQMALRGIAGSWPWAFDPRITSLPFYRSVQGFDRLGANLAALYWWALIYAAIVTPAVVLALWTPRRYCRALAAVIFAGLGLFFCIRFHHIDWNSMIRPLPLCMVAVLVITAIPIIKRRAADDRSLLRFALVIFSLVLLAKIFFNAHVFHYGFALAMPGAAIFVAGIAQGMSQWIERRGGCAIVMRAAVLPAALAALGAVLYVDSIFFTGKTYTIGTGPDAFRGSERSLEIAMMVEFVRQSVPEQGTVQVFPQGLMINYLARRATSIPNVNFMPPEVLAAGEDAILTSLAAHPPDAIVINSSAIRGDEFTLDTDYIYGRRTFEWIRKNYTQVGVANPAPHPMFLRLVLMLRKAPASP